MQIAKRSQNHSAHEDHYPSEARLHRPGIPQQPRGECPQQSADGDRGPGAQRLPGETCNLPAYASSKIEHQPATSAADAFHERADDRKRGEVEHDLPPALPMEKNGRDQSPIFVPRQCIRLPLEQRQQWKEVLKRRGSSGDRENAGSGNRQSASGHVEMRSRRNH